MLLAERESIPLGAGLPVVVERAVDLVAMGVMVSVLAWLVPTPEALTEVVPGIDPLLSADPWSGSGSPSWSRAAHSAVRRPRAVDLVDRLTLRWSAAGSEPFAAPACVRPAFRRGRGSRQPTRLVTILGLTATAWGSPGSATRLSHTGSA